MTKKCADCGKPFTAKRATAKYCGETCRKRAQRRPKPAKATPPVPPPGSGTDEPGPDAPVDFPIGLLASTLAELAKAGRENTPLGQAALLLAYRLERSATDTGSSVAAMVKQHAATMAEALKSAEKASMVDELKRRRDAKRAG